MNKKNKKILNEFFNYLNKKFHFTINNENIYATSLTHESYCYEHEIDLNLSYERLEFLGDSVLSLVVSEYLYKNYPELAVGEISKCRSRIVSGNMLTKLAEKIRLGNYLLLGKTEESSGGRKRASILADAFEALIGAIYLDAGICAAENVILSLYGNMIDKSMFTDFDYKSILQEKIQCEYRELPNYKILKESGPAHKKTFEAAVYHKKKLLGKGKGKSKKEAEQEAAKSALGKI